MLLLVFLGLLASAMAEPQNPTEITDDELKAIHVPTGLDLKKAFRCGLFFPSENPKELPIAPLFIFNASWPAEECPTDDETRYDGFCVSLWDKILEYIVYTNPSLKKERAERGITLGDDICGLVKKKVKAPYVGPKSKKFPKGLKIGMYSNSCGRTKWTDTSRRHPKRVCCKNGVHIPCP